MARGFRREGSQLLAVTGSGEPGVGDWLGAGWALQGPREEKQPGRLTLQLGLDFLKTLTKQKGKPHCVPQTRQGPPHRGPPCCPEWQGSPRVLSAACGALPALPLPLLPRGRTPQVLNIPNTARAPLPPGPVPPLLAPLLLRQWQEPPRLFSECNPHPPGGLNGQVVGVSVSDLALLPSSPVSSSKDGWSTQKGNGPAFAPEMVSTCRHYLGVTLLH